MDNIFDLIKNIKPVNKKIMKEAEAYQLSLAKPPRSLGYLEDISIRLSGITSKIYNNMDRRCLIVFASDNGVTSEHVSSTPDSVTLSQAVNITKGITGASVLAKYFNTDCLVFDVGIKSDVLNSDVINKKIAYGTRNIRKESAMSKLEAYKAIEIGFNAIKDNIDKYDIFGIGEMGIGNTTTSSAVLSVLTSSNPVEVTGKGAGLSDIDYLNKIEVIEDAIKVNKPNKDDVIDVISKVGGFDIASMTGAYLACCYYQKPVVVDGFISIVAALCAYRINNLAKDYFFLSHESFEKGYNIAKKELGLDSLFNLKMRLGEGSGCPIAFDIISASCAVINNMATFKEANINNDYISKIKGEENFTVKVKQ